MSLADQRYRTQLAPWKWAFHAAGALVTTALAFFGWSSLRAVDDWTSDLTQRGSEAESLLLEEPALQARAAALSTQLEQLQTENEGLEKRLPARADEARFSADVAQIAAATGVTVQSIQPGRRTQGADLSELELHLTCDGSYIAVCKFLAELAKLSRAHNVVEMKMAGQETDDSNVRVELKIELLYGKLPAAVTP